MRLGEYANILRNGVRPALAQGTLQKILGRLRERGHREQREAATRWASERAVETREIASNADATLWDEAEAFWRDFAGRAERRLSRAPVKLGGGGNYPLLYFLVRWRRPEVAVETGVAAGFTTQAILAAMERNRCGLLHSSEFPYLRLRDPERYVGCAVDPELRRTRWCLHLRGDRVNLPSIVKHVPRVDLVHYDSDKTYAGRTFAMEVLGPRLSPETTVVMDDIQDNLFFRDFVERAELPYCVLEFEGKYMGLVGPGAATDDPR